MTIRLHWFKVFGLGFAGEYWLQTDGPLGGCPTVLRWHVHAKVYLLVLLINIDIDLWKI